MSRKQISDDDFDPYHKWLGVPRDQRPPTFYQLLGIAEDEEDLEVIRGAVRQKEDYVRKFADGPYREQARSVLYELQEASVTLANPKTRERYDVNLPAIHKRQLKNRQIWDQAPAARRWLPVGEGSGLGRQFSAIVAVLLVAFIAMAVVTFRLPWKKYTSSSGDEVAAEASQGATSPSDRLAQPVAVPAPAPAVAAEPSPNLIASAPPADSSADSKAPAQVPEDSGKAVQEDQKLDDDADAKSADGKRSRPAKHSGKLPAAVPPLTPGALRHAHLVAARGKSVPRLTALFTFDDRDFNGAEGSGLNIEPDHPLHPNPGIGKRFHRGVPFQVPLGIKRYSLANVRFQDSALYINGIVSDERLEKKKAPTVVLRVENPNWDTYMVGMRFYGEDYQPEQTTFFSTLRRTLQVCRNANGQFEILCGENSFRPPAGVGILQPGKWTVIAFGYNVANRHVLGYVDGQQVIDAHFDPHPDLQPDKYPKMKKDKLWNVGRFKYVNAFQGWIDEMSFYNGVMSPELLARIGRDP